MFKAKKFTIGDYTGYIALEGENKTKGKEIVTERVVVGKDDFGDDIYDEVPVKNKYSFMNISRNYPEGEKPKDYKDRESYLAFMSSKEDEKDWVARHKDTKEIEVELDYFPESLEFRGLINGVAYVGKIANEKARTVQFTKLVIKDTVSAPESADDEDLPF